MEFIIAHGLSGAGVVILCQILVEVQGNRVQLNPGWQQSPQIFVTVFEDLILSNVFMEHRMFERFVCFLKC